MTHLGWPVALLFVVCLAGCQAQVDPTILAEREKYLLVDEPDGALGVLETRELIGEDQQQVVLLGKIGAGESSTWEPGKAKFVIRDLTAEMEDHDHGPGHDPDTCPFCKAKKGDAPDPTALVQVVDPNGDVIDIDARKLLPISEEELVVVRGVAQLDSLGHLIVSADGIYVRR